MAAGDDPNQIMAQVIDKVDKVLFKHGLEFDEDHKNWDDAVEQLSAWVFQFYEDFGGDSSFQGNSVSSSSSDEMLMTSEEPDENEEIDLNE